MSYSSIAFSPTTDTRPATVPDAALCRRCDDDTARYRGGGPYDDHVCFAMIRRAVAEGDELCWRAMDVIYSPLVLRWCRAAGTLPASDPDDLVALTWARFWRSFTADKLTRCRGTASVLRYLKMCAGSVVVDTLRARRRTISLDRVDFDRRDDTPLPEEILADQAARRNLWEIVKRHLRDERERVVIHSAYELGLRSAEIQRRRPDLFPTVADVYRITRNVLDRLRHSRELQTWYEHHRE